MLCCGTRLILLYCLFAQSKAFDKVEREPSLRRRKRSFESTETSLRSRNDEGISTKALTVKDCQIVMDQPICSWIDGEGNLGVFKARGIGNWTIHHHNGYDPAHPSARNIADGINKAIDMSFENQPDESIPIDERIDVPVFVLNNRERADRFQMLERCLESVGFVGPKIEMMFTRAHGIDIETLKADHEIDDAGIKRMINTKWIGESALKLYVASALDHLQVIRAGSNSGFERFGIFEDNLSMLSARRGEVRKTIKAALDNIPPNADMLFLEGCDERCKGRKYSTDFPLWVRTSGLSCSSAIIFTLKGARRLLNMMNPIFGGIVDMYNSIIDAGHIEAYVIAPHAFLQEGFWRSGIQAFRDSSRKHSDLSLAGVTHRPFSILCSDDERGDLAVVIAQISFKTPFVERMVCVDPQKDFKILLIADTLSNHVKADSWLSLVYSARDKNNWNGWTEIGRWPQKFGTHGIMLVLHESSECFEFVEEGGCEFKVSGVTVNGETVIYYLHLSSLLFLHKDVHALDDVLITSLHAQLLDAIIKCVDLGLERAEHNGTLTSDHDNESYSQQQSKSSASDCPVDTGSILSGVHIIFDSIMYKGFSGKMSGVNKMWYNIVPFMADAVHAMNGSFTNCQSSWDSGGQTESTNIPRVSNMAGCENLTDVVSRLPGVRKIVFSSYHRIASVGQNDDVCNILPLYDFIPERSDVYDKQHSAFYDKGRNIPFAHGFLSISLSTTADLADLHGINETFVSTSPNRVSKNFRRIKDYGDLPAAQFDGKEEIEELFSSGKRYLLLVGFSQYSPAYKGYDIFWEAVTNMPTSFVLEVAVMIIGGMPVLTSDVISVFSAADVPENVLPVLYSRAAAMVYPSRYEGFGMPPLEAIACGCPVILGSFYESRMGYVYGDTALYGGSIAQMEESLLKVYRGEVPPPSRLMERAAKFGGEPKHGWNEVAKDYLQFMLGGPFRQTGVGRCLPIVKQECIADLRMHATAEGLTLGEGGDVAEVEEALAIREARPADAWELCYFYNHLGNATLKYFMKLGKRVCHENCMMICEQKAERLDLFILSAEDWREKIVGWAFLIEVTEAYPELGIVLADSHQGQGLGGKLMGALLNAARVRGVKLVILNVVEDNERAIAMYSRFGFRILWQWCKEEDRLNYFRMELHLSGEESESQQE